MKKLVFINQKGGVAKSMTAYHKAHYLAERRKRVLFIEADEQGNSGKSLAMYKAPGIGAEVMFGDAPVNLPTLAQDIVVLAGGPGLRAVEKSDNDAKLVANLKARLEEVSQGFDYCVIDTPGSNSKAANAFLVVSDFVIVPCIVDTYSLDVATTVLQRIVGIQKQFNPGLVNLGILPTLFDATAPTQKADLERLLSNYHQYVIKAKISKRSAFREASAQGVPVWKLDKTSAREAGKEIRAAFDLIAEKMGVQ